MHKQNNRTRIICRNWARVKDHCYSKRRSSKSSLFVRLLNNSMKRRGKRKRKKITQPSIFIDSLPIKELEYIYIYIYIQRWMGRIKKYR